ncbi:hypothetical protein Q1695_014756 [Nippostrongylus brasiliensis]|nr:hypothetical protein Q1695_014756 [Nippostrongylus brasiliensis]
MTLTFASTKHRYSVHDVLLLDTSVDGPLYNDNYRICKDDVIESFFYNTEEINYHRPMPVEIAVNGVRSNGDRIAAGHKVTRENRISSHLNEAERRSILTYLEPSAKALCTGVCQLLQAENEVWTDMKVGVICFIRDPQIKEYVLSLLLPKTDGRYPAKVLWTMNVSAFFETERTTDEHLLTFVMESYPRDICGLNFYDPREADEFHRILVEENRGRISRRASSRPKQRAPPPPSEATEAIERLNQLAAPTHVDDAQKKEHRKSFLGGFFTMKKKKKERKKLDISAPVDFQHIDHLGLEELSPEDQETFQSLIKAVDIEPGNQAQIQLIRDIVATRGSEVRSSIRLKRNSIRPTDGFVRGSPGSTHNTLADSRNSMMVVHKQQRRTPREVKKSSVKRQELEVAPQEQFIKEEHLDQYLNPDWGATPSYEPATNLRVITEAAENTRTFLNEHQYLTPSEPEAPPVPSRIESMGGHRSPIDRRISAQSPYPSVSEYRRSPSPISAPQLPERQNHEPELTTPVWRIEIPLPNGAQAPPHSPPPTPPSSQPSPVPKYAPIPRPLDGPRIGAAPPPPPPPPGLLSPAHTPPPGAEAKQTPSDVSPISNDRRSFLEEIQNVDKGRLRHVDVNEITQTKPCPNGDSPTGDGGLLSAIQAELDKRREYIATDSDEESDSSDSDWTD